MNPAVARILVEALERAADRMGIEGASPTSPALALGRELAIEGFVSRHLRIEALTEEVRARRLAQRLYERSLLDAAQDLSRALAAQNIRHFFVRGVALAGTVYHLGDRELADIDVYVLPPDVARVRAILADQRYKEIDAAGQSGPQSLRPSVVVERAARGAEFAGVAVDLHWGIEPVDRLLPRPDLHVPAAIWERLATNGSLPVPAPEHHAALLVHHLVHHDMLHVRSLLDLALLWPSIPPEGGPEFEATAGRLGVLRAARVLHRMLTAEFGLEPLVGVADPPRDRRERRLARFLELDRWLARAARANLEEHQAITVSRVRLRLLLLDRLYDARRLVQDALWPPAEFLRWRWPLHRSLLAARGRHLGRVAAKLLARGSAGG